MLSQWPIRYKLLFGIAILLAIVVVLSYTGFHAVTSYRQLVRSISYRARELPLTAKLTQSVDALRFRFTELHPNQGFPVTHNAVISRQQFSMNLEDVHDNLEDYKAQLTEHEVPLGSPIGDNSQELQLVRKIERTLENVDTFNQTQSWVFDHAQYAMLNEQLNELHLLVGRLPSYLQDRMKVLHERVRGEYRTLIVVNLVTSLSSVTMFFLLGRLFYAWVFSPLRLLLHGSRRVAAGEFSHRIQLPNSDEMAELAGAMNAMTSRFQEIRDDLDRQVKQRTKEVVRSEQLASVGFLGAGVAHEINNPLASIAWSAESLETRIERLVYRSPEVPGEKVDEDMAIVRKYVRRIQDEAFRCKGITERLLDFSRLGDVEKANTDLRELVQSVIEMVRDLGKYRHKRIEFACRETVVANINPQEIKQVVLNLITNALDSLEADGVVCLRLQRNQRFAELVVEDNGCGMTEEVCEHLFEPFFTRRRDGQGTGLGLSISFRIVNDHGGSIEAQSDGPGTGSRFCVTLPLAANPSEAHEQARYAA